MAESAQQVEFHMNTAPVSVHFKMLAWSFCFMMCADDHEHTLESRASHGSWNFHWFFKHKIFLRSAQSRHFAKPFFYVMLLEKKVNFMQHCPCSQLSLEYLFAAAKKRIDHKIDNGNLLKNRKRNKKRINAGLTLTQCKRQCENGNSELLSSLEKINLLFRLW